jgi:hypothetical protein
MLVYTKNIFFVPEKRTSLFQPEVEWQGWKVLYDWHQDHESSSSDEDLAFAFMILEKKLKS